MRPGGKTRLPRAWGSNEKMRVLGPSGETDSEGLGLGKAGLHSACPAPEPRGAAAGRLWEEGEGRTGKAAALGRAPLLWPPQQVGAQRAGGGARLEAEPRPQRRALGVRAGATAAAAAAARAGAASGVVRVPAGAHGAPGLGPAWRSGAGRCRDRRQRRCSRLAAALSGSAVGKWLPLRFLSSPGCLLRSDFNRLRRSRGEGKKWYFPSFCTLHLCLKK